MESIAEILLPLIFIFAYLMTRVLRQKRKKAEDQASGQTQRRPGPLDKLNRMLEESLESEGRKPSPQPETDEDEEVFWLDRDDDDEEEASTVQQRPLKQAESGRQEKLKQKTAAEKQMTPVEAKERETDGESTETRSPWAKPTAPESAPSAQPVPQPPPQPSAPDTTAGLKAEQPPPRPILSTSETARSRYLPRSFAQNNLRQAVVWSEILSPPLGLRDPGERER